MPDEAEYQLRIEREANGISFAQETLELFADLAMDQDIADAVSAYSAYSSMPPAEY